MTFDKLKNTAAAATTTIAIAFGSAAVADTRLKFLVPDADTGRITCFETETSAYAGRNEYVTGEGIQRVTLKTPGHYFRGNEWPRMERDYNQAIENGTRLPQAAYDIGTERVAPGWARDLSNQLVRDIVRDTPAIAGIAYVGGNRRDSVTFEARAYGPIVGDRGMRQNELNQFASLFDNCTYVDSNDRPDRNPVDGRGYNKDLRPLISRLER